MKSNKLKIALPSGSLKSATLELFNRAGYKINVSDRSYFPTINDSQIECVLLRAQEISRYVERGKFDLGITGKDWILENNSVVSEVGELKYSKKGFNPIKLAIAVPKDSMIRSLSDLSGKIIATELVNITTGYLKKKEISASVEYSWGATEAKPPYLVDAIAELVDSGASLKANNLRIIDIILESTTRIIANKSSLENKWKREKIDEVSMLLKMALDKWR